MDDPEFLELLRKKMAVPGTEPVQLTQERLRSLEQQRLTELPVVLRARDVNQFDLDRVWAALTTLVKKLK
jgi:hypothetical protein